MDIISTLNQDFIDLNEKAKTTPISDGWINAYNYVYKLFPLPEELASNCHLSHLPLFWFVNELSGRTDHKVSTAFDEICDKYAFLNNDASISVYLDDGKPVAQYSIGLGNTQNAILRQIEAKNREALAKELDELLPQVWNKFFTIAEKHEEITLNLKRPVLFPDNECNRMAFKEPVIKLRKLVESYCRKVFGFEAQYDTVFTGDYGDLKASLELKIHPDYDCPSQDEISLVFRCHKPTSYVQAMTDAQAQRAKNRELAEKNAAQEILDVYGKTYKKLCACCEQHEKDMYRLLAKSMESQIKNWIQTTDKSMPLMLECDPLAFKGVHKYQPSEDDQAILDAILNFSDEKDPTNFSFNTIDIAQRVCKTFFTQEHLIVDVAYFPIGGSTKYMIMIHR